MKSCSKTNNEAKTFLKLIMNLLFRYISILIFENINKFQIILILNVKFSLIAVKRM